MRYKYCFFIWKSSLSFLKPLIQRGIQHYDNTDNCDCYEHDYHIIPSNCLFDESQTTFCIYQTITVFILIHQGRESNLVHNRHRKSQISPSIPLCLCSIMPGFCSILTGHPILCLGCCSLLLLKWCLYDK